MRNFFQSLEEQHVRHLLVSGQAAVLYGAALFSEDVDLWVDPTEENFLRLEYCLREHQAVYHKLTPPLTVENALKHHGFHYRVQDGAGGDFYLDVLGSPPRTDAFQTCLDRAIEMETGWGRLPVVGVRDLVEIKKTQRLKDYPVISRLALGEVTSHGSGVDTGTLDWAWSHMFELEDATRFLGMLPEAQSGWRPGNGVGAEWISQKVAGVQTDELDAELESEMMERMTAFRQADRKFWRGVIDELRSLRAENRLCPEGEKV